MAKWKCEICEKEFENFHAQGFDNKIYCPLCYFKKENQELKKKYENAVADYETTMFEKEQLNSLVNSCQEEIRRLKKQLEENKDKINWYENFEINKTIDKLRIKHNNQQKEFIEYLENGIYSIEPKGTGINYNCEYDSEEDYINAMEEQSKLDTFTEILSKFKKIIGSDINVASKGGKDE